MDTQSYEKFMGKANSEKALLTLRGIIEGIALDGSINAAEMDELTNWISIHKSENTQKPFSELIPVIEDALADNVLEKDEIDDIIWLCNQYLEGGRYYDLNTMSLQVLQGIFHGLLADDVLSDIEIKRLSDWLDDNDILAGSYPYDEIRSLITAVLADGIITEDERKQLFLFMSDFIDTKESYNISQPEIDTLKSQYNISGICSIQPDITIEGKLFCFTGASSRGTRNEIASVIEEHGGLFNKSVIKKTDFLIVGDDGNPCWAFSCYGRKVERAVELRKTGSKIQIVHESDFWDAL